MQKGISAVIATILLLLIAIAITGFAFTFFSRTVETTSNATQSQLQQQTQQIGTLFSIEGVDKNQVFIRNKGATPLTGLAFYVNNVNVNYTGPGSLAPNSVGTYLLNSTQLIMQPDPAELRITSSGFSDKITANFYTSNMIAYWKFDEGSGNTAADSVRNNTATLSGATWVSGKYGNAVDVNNTKYVSLGTILPASSFTLAFWSNANSYYSGLGVNGNVIMAGEQYTVNGFRSGFNEQGYYSFWTTQSGGTLSVAATSPAPVGTWHHYAISYQSGVPAKLYKDGILESTASGTYVLSVVPMYIASGTGGVVWFNGRVDEVKILNIAV